MHIGGEKITQIEWVSIGRRHCGMINLQAKQKGVDEGNTGQMNNNNS
jgi:hypothetical protein